MVVIEAGLLSLMAIDLARQVLEAMEWVTSDLMFVQFFQVMILSQRGFRPKLILLKVTTYPKRAKLLTPFSLLVYV